jgi:hypothetical protein
VTDARDELRRLCEEARQRAQETPEPVEAQPEPMRRPKAAAARPPVAPRRHWQEAAEDGDDGPAALSLEAGDLAAHASSCQRLRALLADGAWHSALELVERVGLRYGSRLHEIRHGLDGAPALNVEAESRSWEGRRVWVYRLARGVAAGAQP